MKQRKKRAKSQSVCWYGGVFPLHVSLHFSRKYWTFFNLHVLQHCVTNIYMRDTLWAQWKNLKFIRLWPWDKTMNVNKAAEWSQRADVSVLYCPVIPCQVLREPDTLRCRLISSWMFYFHRFHRGFLPQIKTGDCSGVLTHRDLPRPHRS